MGGSQPICRQAIACADGPLGEETLHVPHEDVHVVASDEEVVEFVSIMLIHVGLRPQQGVGGKWGLGTRGAAVHKAFANATLPLL